MFVFFGSFLLLRSDSDSDSMRFFLSLRSHLRSCNAAAKWCCLHHFVCVLPMLFSSSLPCTMWHISRIIISSISSFMCCFSQNEWYSILEQSFFLCLPFPWCVMLLCCLDTERMDRFDLIKAKIDTDKEARRPYISHVYTINKSYLYVLGQAYWWIWWNRNKLAREKSDFVLLLSLMSLHKKRTQIERILNYCSNSTIIIHYSVLLPLKQS